MKNDELKNKLVEEIVKNINVNIKTDKNVKVKS